MTTETLQQKQTRFVWMIIQLLTKAKELNYEITFGDAFRDPRVFGPIGVTKPGAYGVPSSCHKLRLAIDLNLFINGQFKETTKDHKTLGEYWESIGGTWGGRFNDANHYSLEHNGVK